MSTYIETIRNIIVHKDMIITGALNGKIRIIHLKDKCEKILKAAGDIMILPNVQLMSTA